MKKALNDKLRLQACVLFISHSISVVHTQQKKKTTKLKRYPWENLGGIKKKASSLTYENKSKHREEEED